MLNFVQMGLYRPQFSLDLHAKHTKRCASQRCIFWCALREGRWPPAAARAPRRSLEWPFLKRYKYTKEFVAFFETLHVSKEKVEVFCANVLTSTGPSERSNYPSKSINFSIFTKRIKTRIHRLLPSFYAFIIAAHVWNLLTWLLRLKCGKPLLVWNCQ